MPEIARTFQNNDMKESRTVGNLKDRSTLDFGSFENHWFTYYPQAAVYIVVYYTQLHQGITESYSDRRLRESTFLFLRQRGRLYSVLPFNLSLKNSI